MKEEFIESGNYRIGKLIKKSSGKNLVRCNIDDLILLISQSEVPLDNISVGDKVQVFRLTKDTCLLLFFESITK